MKIIKKEGKKRRDGANINLKIMKYFFQKLEKMLCEMIFNLTDK